MTGAPILVLLALLLGRPSRAFTIVPLQKGPWIMTTITRRRPASTPVTVPRARCPFGILLGSTPSDDDDLDLDDDDDDVEPDDVPADWSEEDILAEIGDASVEDAPDIDPADEPDEEELQVVMEEEIDEDDIDLDEIDLDEEDEEEDEDEIVEEDLDAEVVAEESIFDDDDWDEDEDGGDYPLVDDPEDPNYMRQKELVEEAIERSEKRTKVEAMDPLQFLAEQMTEEEASLMDKLPFFQQVQERVKDMVTLEPADVSSMDIEAEMAKVSDLMDDDPYPRHLDGEVNLLEQDVGLTDDDMEELDNAYKEVNRFVQQEPWDKVMLSEQINIDDLSNKTIEEMEAALDELGGSAYNVTRWLLYDLHFNVSNLILAAVQHNPDAPILFQHWYPQLVTYERYQHARDRNFDFTWQDVKNADLSELQRYYAGFGYDEIPNKAPAETGIIGLEELDEEEIKMAAFENWMTDVYNPEWDRYDFDDDDMRDEDNVFSDFYDAPQHPDLPTMEDAEDDLDEWKEELLGEYGDEEDEEAEVRSYRTMMGQKFEYEVERDEEFEREFRGHLVIACTSSEEDLDVAEKITLRFEKEFGKKVFVETRVLALAREEDNVYEIWLESYEIDLLHSKKRATSNTQDWQGPAEVDAAEIDQLVEDVRFLISDEARYSYRMELEHSD